MTLQTTTEQFRAARNAGVPIVALSTPDQAASVHQLRGVLEAADEKEKGKKQEPTVLTWDVVRGLKALTAPAAAWIKALSAPQPPPPGMPPQPPFNIAQTADPVVALDVLDSAKVKLPEDACVFFYNAHLFWKDRPVIQGIANLRDGFKDRGQTVVLLGSEARLPVELVNDVVALHEPLPSDIVVREIIKQQYENVRAQGVKPPTNETLDKAVDATIGLSAFSVEQVAAMCMTKEGLDIDATWDRKISVIEQTRGLKVWRGKEDRKSYAGGDGIAEYIAAFQGVRVVAYIDEIEKGTAGARGDLSGVSQDQLGTLLSWTEDQEVIGLLLVGAPGTGKTYIAKVAGNMLKVPTIQIDLGAMQGSLVGESQQMIRHGLGVVDAIAQGKGKTLLLATCNSVDSLPPELIRRFKFGVYYFDLMTADVRREAWKIHMTLNGLAEQPIPNDENWTGAEIRSCCQIAARTGWTLLTAAERIVPTYKANPHLVENLRQQAQERGFINAASGLPFVNAGAEATLEVVEAEDEKPTRKIKVGSGSVN